MRFIPRSGLALAVLLALALGWGLATAAEHASAQVAQLDRLRPAASPAAPPVVEGVPFLIQFGGTVRGLQPGAAVEISGIRIGAVRRIGLEFSPDRNGFVVPVEIELQPSLFPAAGPRPRTTEETYAAADALVRRGLRAQVTETQLLGGETIVALEMQPGSAPAQLVRSGAVPELPAGPTRGEAIAERLRPLIDKLAAAPVDQVFADMQASMTALKELASGPELRGALSELRGAAAELRGLVGRLGPNSDVLVGQLNETLRATNRMIDRSSQTLATLDRQVGDRSPLLAELRGVLRELGGAARAMRLMAENLERNPSALITGKSDNRR